MRYSVALITAVILSMANIAMAQSSTYQQAYSGFEQSVKNANYNMGGFTATLRDGVWQTHQGSTQLTLSQYALGDLSRDGIEDAAVVLRYDSGGSSYYYLAPAINKQARAVNVHTLSLASHMRPESISIENSTIYIALQDSYGKPSYYAYVLDEGEQLVLLNSNQWVSSASAPATGAASSTQSTIITPYSDVSHFWNEGGVPAGIDLEK